MTNITRQEIELETWKDTDGTARMMRLRISSIQGSSMLELTARADSPLWQHPATHLEIVEALFRARRVELRITGRAE